MVVWFLKIMIPSQSKLFNYGLYWTGPGCGFTTYTQFSIMNTKVTNQAIQRHTQHNHTKPSPTKIHHAKPNIKLIWVTLCYSVPHYIALSLSILIKKVITWWCGSGGGGVVYLIDYRTTPVKTVQLWTELGCGNIH